MQKRYFIIAIQFIIVLLALTVRLFFWAESQLITEQPRFIPTPDVVDVNYCTNCKVKLISVSEDFKLPDGNGYLRKFRDVCPECHYGRPGMKVILKWHKASYNYHLEK